MPRCALGCYTDNRTVFFDVPASKKQKLYTIRVNRWKAALKIDPAKPNPNTCVCSEHFFLKEPAHLEDRDNPDWVPWLKLNPGELDDPVQVQQRMQQYYEKWHEFNQQMCCISSCPSSNGKHSTMVSLFDFPALDTSSYKRRVLSERRLLTWIQVIQQPDLWNRFDIHTLKICGKHFVSGQMAKLTDVKNLDWIPTRGLSRSVGFTDHVAYFDLHNIVSLALEDAESSTVPEQEVIPSDDDDSMDQPVRLKMIAAPVSVKQQPPSKPKPQVNVGFKCILCLGNAALKPLTPVDQVALDEFFKDKLCVKSELICKTCCKHITDFHSFHVSILKIQNGAVTRQIKNIIPVPSPAPPVGQIKKAESLFKALSPDTFQCNLCRAIMVGKELLNKHLHAQHKVKINCKLCKTSFSPEGYALHRKTCVPPKPAIAVKTVPPKASVIPAAPNNTTEKYSCYICTQFFTPDEMKEHIKTHDNVIKSAGSRTRVPAKVVVDESYESCKRCNRAVHKNDRERHQRQHDEERERLKELIARQASSVHKCGLCQASFPSADLLQTHRAIHQKHKCSECNKEFAQAHQLNNHKKEFHGIELISETRYMTECSDCNSLINSATYKVHVAQEHDSCQIACELCGKQMIRIALKKHQESSCNDDNPMVPCTVCERIMQSTEIKHHVEAIHSKEKFSHNEQTAPQKQPAVCLLSEVVMSSTDQLDDLIEEDLVEERLDDEFQPEEYVESAFQDDELM